jgi:uncharacterized protein
MKLKDKILERREEILKITAKHGAYNVRIFGSVARGEETNDSDIDFLIDFDLEKISPWFPVRLKRELEQLLGKKIDVVTETGLKERVRDRVLKDAIKL